MVVDRRGDGRRPTLSLVVLHLHRRLERHDPPVGTRRRQLILRRKLHLVELEICLVRDLTSGVLGGGYTRVYAVYQPPGFFWTAYTHLSDHK